MARVIPFQDHALASLRERLGAAEEANQDLIAFARGHSGAVAAIHEAVIAGIEADSIDDSLKPTRAYRDPIVEAARANGLPDDYVEQLALTPTLD